MKVSSTIRVGMRPSRLARIQAAEVRDLLRDAGVAVEWVETPVPTSGDRDRSLPLADAPDDFFTDGLDEALREGRIDVAVHSAKDLPATPASDLEILALTAASDESDAFVGPKALTELPPGARIGTSSPLRREQIRRCVPHLEPVDIRGNIEERLRQVVEGRYDGVIVAACALRRLGLAARIRETCPWQTAPLQGQLAVVGRRGETRWRELFAVVDVRRRYGRVSLVGAGPGDPDLITLAGVRALQEADSVYYDYLVDRRLLAHAPRARHHDVGKRKGDHTLPQEELQRRIRLEAAAGRNVVRLKGGDPLIFGRGGDELAYLWSYHIPTEVIPGVSSGTGVPAVLSVPLTRRGLADRVLFFSGHGRKDGGVVQVPAPDAAATLVVFMGLTRIGEIRRGLLEAGWPEETPVLVVSRGTWPEERVLEGRLGDIADRTASAACPHPGLLVIGRAAAFGKDVGPRRPVFLYCGTRPGRYRALGRVLPHPMIEIVPVDSSDLRSVFARWCDFSIILLTSPHAVEHFCTRLSTEGIPRRTLDEKTTAVIGEETARTCRRHGIHPEVVSREEHSGGLLAALAARIPLRGRRVLWPRSSLPNPGLSEGLTALGASVREVCLYETRKPAFRPLPEGPIDGVVFTSPSTMRHFLEDHGPIPREWRIFHRGPKTAACLREAGYAGEPLPAWMPGRRRGEEVERE